MKFGLRSLFIVLLLSSLAGSCGGSESFPEGVVVNVVVPDPNTFPDINPFDQCHYVEVCYVVDGSEDCTTVTEAEKEAALKPVGYGDEVVITMSCRPQVQEGGNVVPGPVLAHGRTVPFAHDKSADPEEVNLFMLPVSSTGPTVDSDGMQTSPVGAHWGAVTTVLRNDFVLIAGGAEFKEGCTAWDTPDCVNSVVQSAQTYDPGSGEFFPIGFGTAQQMTEARAFAASVTLPSGEVAIFGGIGDGGNTLTTVEIFDPVSGTFSKGMDMNDSRAWHTAVLVDDSNEGYVLLVGGYGSGAASWEVWNKIDGPVGSGNLSGSRWNHSATLVTGISGARDMVVIAGGESDTAVLDNFEIFDLTLQKPTFDPEPYPLCLSANMQAQGGEPKSKTLHAAALVKDQRFLYFVGGFSDKTHQQPVGDICVWSVKNEDFSDEAAAKLSSLSIPRGGLKSSVLPGNVVLLSGGLTSDNGVLKTTGSVEIIFEYINVNKTKVIELGKPIAMQYARWGHEAVATADNRVLLLGGVQYNQGAYMPVSSTEVFNPDPL